MLEIANNRVPVPGHWPPGKWRARRKWASGMKVEAKAKGQRAKGKGEVIRSKSLTDAMGFLRNGTL